LSGRDEAPRLLAESRRVKRYIFRPSGRVRWIVVGRERDYLVFPEAPYCSCDDFYFRVLHGQKPSCYHLEAYVIAVREGIYEEIEEEDGWYYRLMDEWLGG
jgi:predicted nucleic acid-binding Zn finger protein